MSTQSWTAWLLDSYASSVSHQAPDDTEPTEDDSTHARDPSLISTSTSTSTSVPSSATSMGSSASQPSPYSPYIRTGRGGAGNFHWDSQQPSADTEAQKPASLAERRKSAAKLERIETGDAMSKRTVSAPFMHVGRGGAGNYTQSNEIQSAKSPRSASSTYAPMALPVTVWRGGAGNVGVALEARDRLKNEKEEIERREAEMRRERVVSEVDGMLERPPGARIAVGSRRSSMLLQDV